MASHDPPSKRRLAAVWFADIVGYSALAAGHEAAAMKVVEILQRTADRAARDAGGRIVKFLGDGALAEFSSTEAAVRSAAELARTYADESGATGNPSLLTIGIHMGDVVAAPDGDLYGDGVNTAARLQAIARPGEILLSEDVHRQIRQIPELSSFFIAKRALEGVGSIAVYGIDLDVAPGKGDSRRLRGIRRRVIRRFRALPHRTPLFTAAALAAVFAVGLASGRIPWRSESPGAAWLTDRSIVVIPFENVGGDPEQEYFSDGFTDELIASLTRVPELHVVGRTSSFALKGEDMTAEDVGRRLDVATVLEGSIRRAGDRIRVTAQLVDAKEGFQLWSETYEREVRDVFRVQEELSGAIVDALEIRLEQGPSAGLVRISTRDPEAYQLYLKGRYFWNQRSSEAIAKSIDFFQRAIDRDSLYAQAWAGLADAHLFAVTYGNASAEEAFPRAYRAAGRALELDPASAEAHTSMALIRQRFERRWAEAEREYRRAIELNPNYPVAHLWLSLLLVRTGRADEALAENRRAVELDPLSAPAIAFLGDLLVLRGEGEEAIEQYQRILELYPGSGSALWHLGYAYLATGRLEDAEASFKASLEVASRSRRADPMAMAGLGSTYAAKGDHPRAQAVLGELRTLAGPDKQSSLYALAILYTALGDHDRAFETLDRAYAARDSWLDDLTGAPYFDPLKNDPRYFALLRKMGLAR